MQSDTLEEWYAIRFSLNLEKKCHRNVWNASDCFLTILPDQASVFEWHKRVKEGRESMRDDERCGGVRKSEHQSWLAKGLGLELLCWGFKGVQVEIPWEEASPLQIGSVAFQLGNAPVHNSILFTDYLTKMGIKTVPQAPYSPDLTPCDFWLFLKLRGCRYETIE